MAKPALLLDIGEGAVAAALSVAGLSSPVDFATEPITADGGLKAALKGVLAALTAEGTVAAADVEDVYVSIHPGYMHLRVVEVPFRERRKVREVLAFELAGTLSVDVADSIIDSVPLGPTGPEARGGEGGGHKTLAVAIEKSFMRELFAIFDSLGLDPVWVGPALFMAPGFMESLYGEGEGVQAFVTGDFISVTSGSTPTLFNYFKGTEGLALSLAYLKAEGGEGGGTIDKVRSVGFDAAVLAALLPASEVEEVTLPGGLPAGGGGGAAISVLWFGVTSGAVKDAINLRTGEFAYTREALRVRGRLALAAALVALLLLILSGDFYVRYRALAGVLASYGEAIEASYLGLFPGESTGGDPLYALEIKSKELEGEASLVMGGINPLEVMKTLAAVSETDPGLGIRLTELRMAGGKVNAKGRAASFDAANRFRDLLAGHGAFTGVTLSDVKKSGAAAAAFRLTIEVG